MNENEEVLVPTDTEIESAWNDEEVEAKDDGEQEPLEADQPKENAPVQEETTEKKELEGEQMGADQPLTFDLKHLDETRTVGKDEIVKLAQQGMDYDRVRTERDQLRAYRSETDPALALIKSFAEKNRMSTTEYVDYCRKNELMAAGVSEQGATVQMAAEKQQADTKAATDAQEKERTQVRRADLGRFLQKFPTVKPDEIPKEVWTDVAKGDSLAAAYTEYRNRKLEAELAAERQNRENAQKTTGSLSASGAGKRDEIDKWWNSD